MRISSVRIRGFRSLKDVSITLDPYVALIGANGTGKSTVLYALDWFFNGVQLEPSDVHGFTEGTVLPLDSVVEVSVTLVDLSDRDRLRLKQYGRGERAEFRRTWHAATGVTKVVGNARQGPGFAAVRALTRVTEARPAYVGLRNSHPELRDLGRAPSRDEIFQALDDWEADATSGPKLVEVQDDDANHMFGINGPNVLKECLRLVLVPAATNIAGHVGQAGRGSALNELVGSLLAEATATAQLEWARDNAVAIASLRTKVADSVERAVEVQQVRVNANLRQYVPRALVSLTPSVPEWAPKTDAAVSTTVTIDGTTTDVSRQGHGVQRAVLMAMLQAYVPDEELVRSQLLTSASDEGRDDVLEASVSVHDIDATIAESVASLPSLVICIEEPEVYQHPVRIRAFARTLHNLSQRSNVQVVVATHSPFLVRPDQFPFLRRFAIDGGSTTVTSATAASISEDAGVAEGDVAANVERFLPTVFSEGFFADGVVLVEGATDCVAIGAAADLAGVNLDGLGIAVLEVGSKSAMRLAHAILDSLGVPTFLVVDGDALAASRKHGADSSKAAAADATHQAEFRRLLEWLPRAASGPESVEPQYGGATTVTSIAAIWRDDIEEEMLGWPSVVASANALGLDLAARKSKQRLAYKQAISGGLAVDMPNNLRDLLGAIVKLVSSA